MDRPVLLMLSALLLSVATALLATMLVVWVVLNPENDWRLFLLPTLASYAGGAALLVRGLRQE